MSFRDRFKRSQEAEEGQQEQKEGTTRLAPIDVGSEEKEEKKKKKVEGEPPEREFDFSADESTSADVTGARSFNIERTGTDATPPDTSEDPDRPSLMRQVGRAFWPEDPQEQRQRVGAAVATFASGIGLAPALTGVGAPAAPATSVAAGTMGYGIGYSTAGAVQEMLGMSEEEMTSVDMAAETVNEMKDDALWSMGFMAAGPAMGMTARRILGIRPGNSQKDKTLQAADALRKEGIEVPVVTLSDNSFIQGIPTVTGVFPFASGPLRKQRKMTEAAMQGTLKRKLQNHGPDVNLQAMGFNVQQSARNQSLDMDFLNDMNYRAFHNVAEAMGQPKTIPMNGVSHSLKNSVKQAKREGTFDANNPLWKKVLKMSGQDKYTISPSAWHNLKRDINDTTRGIAKDAPLPERRAKAALLEAKKQLEEAGANNMDQTLHDMHQFADEFFMASRRTFEDSRVARNFFAQVDPETFGRGSFKNIREGMAVDHLARNLMLSDSAQDVRSLRNIVGNKKTKELGAARVREAMQQATRNLDGAETVDWRRFREILKLDDQGSREVLGEFFQPSVFGEKMQDANRLLREASEVGLESREGRQLFRQYQNVKQNIDKMRQSGIEDWHLKTDNSEFLQFLDNVSNVGMQDQHVNIRDSSTFLKRRITLTGAAAVTGMFSPTIGLTYVGLIAATRGMSHIMANKTMARHANKLFDPDVTETAATSALGSIWNGMEEGERAESFGDAINFIAEVNGMSPGKVLKSDKAITRFAKRLPSYAIEQANRVTEAGRSGLIVPEQEQRQRQQPRNEERFLGTM